MAQAALTKTAFERRPVGSTSRGLIGFTPCPVAVIPAAYSRQMSEETRR
ncbi:hypothetical protein [Pseudonocardia acaciae]|nr:hypothetical protein [Pseudonocardia acaciae]